MTCANAATARTPRCGETRTGGAGGASAAKYFFTVRRFNPVCRAISVTLAPDSNKARKRRSSIHRCASSTIDKPFPATFQPAREVSPDDRYTPTQHASPLCTFTRTWPCTLVRTPTDGLGGLPQVHRRQELARVLVSGGVQHRLAEGGQQPACDPDGDVFR